jgi:three-Cys-motif partner protein
MDENRRLFELSESESANRAPATQRKRHLRPVERDDQLNFTDHREGAVPDNDGLYARPVKGHSARKGWMVRRDLDIVTVAMNRQWFKVHYLELFAGPGMLLDQDTGEYTPGSPVQALSIRRPFDSYTFSDFSSRCIHALRQRVPMDARVRILCGDANNPAHLADIVAPIPLRDLVIAYLDPQGLELDFATVRFLAERFRAIDFLINLPVSGIHRALAAGHGAGAAKTLDHPAPMELLRCGPQRVPDAIRRWHEGKLNDLGLGYVTRRVVCVQANNSPLYDVVYASRHPRGVELFNKANAEDHGGQLGLDVS